MTEVKDISIEEQTARSIEWHGVTRSDDIVPLMEAAGFGYLSEEVADLLDEREFLLQRYWRWFIRPLVAAHRNGRDLDNSHLSPVDEMHVNAVTDLWMANTDCLAREFGISTGAELEVVLGAQRGLKEGESLSIKFTGGIREFYKEVMRSEAQAFA